MIARLSLLLLVVCVGLAAWAPVAHAQDNTAAARALFDEGRALMEDNKVAEACAKFEASQKQAAKASTALNLGVCYDKLKRYATAWSTFGTAATLAAREGHEEREAFAREQQKAMDAKVARLTIRSADETPELEILLDGKPVIAAMLGTALPIDPGKHTLSAAAPGKQAWSKDFVVPETQAALTETVPVLEPDEVAVPAPLPVPLPVAATPDPPPKPTPAPDKVDDGSLSPLVYVGFSVGGVGLVVGAVAGIVAISNTANIKDGCVGEDNTRCGPEQREAIDDATVVANVSNAMFAVAAAGVVVGIVGLFIGDDDSDVETAIAPYIGPGSVGVHGTF